MAVPPRTYAPHSLKYTYRTANGDQCAPPVALKVVASCVARSADWLRALMSAGVDGASHKKGGLGVDGRHLLAAAHASLQHTLGIRTYTVGEDHCASHSESAVAAGATVDWAPPAGLSRGVGFVLSSFSLSQDNVVGSLPHGAPATAITRT
jgi:hypothetical protein